MIKHLCFTDHRMTNSANKCSQSALKFGCDQTVIYSPQNIDEGFRVLHSQILNQDRGAGYWLWKPYFILKEMKAAQDGDFIVYTDAGLEFVADVGFLISEMKQEVMLFGNGHRHGDWCKADVLEQMNCLGYVDCDQVQASCVIVQNNQRTRDFVEEWLKYCTKEGFIDDSPSQLPNCDTFKEHRHDQAILTNMAYIYGIKLNRWPAQYRLRGEEKYLNKYPQMFLHLGLRNNGKRQ